MGIGIQARMAAHRLASVEQDDHTWDAAEVRGLADLARTADGFDRDGVAFMVAELGSDVAFEPAVERWGAGRAISGGDGGESARCRGRSRPA